MSDDERKTIETAQVVCRDWRACMEALAGTKPLTPAWLPKTSPISGQAGQCRDWAPDRPSVEGAWWDWSPERPSVLLDRQTGQALPDTFPFHNHAARRAFEHAVLPSGNFSALERAHKATGDETYLRTAVAIMAAFSPIYREYPLTTDRDADDQELRTRPPGQLGQRLQRLGAHAWEETTCLQHWLRLYAHCREVLTIAPEDDDAVRSLAQAVIETDSLPPAVYFLDKYHNSMTNYYEAFVRAAVLWGQRLLVRDLVSGDAYTGGDLAQLAVNGPVGIRLFALNAFDRNGVYWELSGSYTGYVLGYFNLVLPVLAGYSDPDGYEPGDAIRPFYKPLRGLDLATALPTLWRAVAAQNRLSQVNLLWPPSNDTDYLNGLSPDGIEAWAARLRAEPLLAMLEPARAAQARLAQGQPPHFPVEDTTLMPAAGALTARGPERRMDFHLDWHRMQDYHSHKDPLNFVIAADGYLVLTDLGYHLGTPLRHLISERTVAHNTVTVDGEDARNNARGMLHRFVGDGDVKLAEASVPDAYPQCDRYRRSLVLVGDRYVVDVFRVAGGSRHDYVLVSRADSSRCSLELVARPGSVACPDVPWPGYDHLDQGPSTRESPYALLHHPSLGRATAAFTVDWPQRDRPDLTTRAHYLGKVGADVALAKVPQADRRAPGRPVLDDQVLMVRRQGHPGLTSMFVSVVECLSGAAAPLDAVECLEVESLDLWAVAVRVRHDHGTEVTLLAMDAGRHMVPSLDLAFTGHFAHIRYGRDGAALDATLTDGVLSGPFGRIEAARPESARVVRVDVAAGEVELDAPVAADGSLAGRFVIVRSGTGRQERWLVRKSTHSGRVLCMDLDHSCMVVLQGPIDRVENDRVFVSRMPLPADPPEGTPVRVGPVGDFNAPRHGLDWCGRSSFPLRIGGTVIDGLRREVYFGLDIHAKLTPDAVGQTFWVSGIETGDEVFTEPITRQEIG